METQMLIRLVVGLWTDSARAGVRRQARAVADDPDPLRPEDQRTSTAAKTTSASASPPRSKRSSGKPGCCAGRSPALAHFFTMWGFFILATVYLEAYGLLFAHDFAIPFVGHWEALGFLQDFFAVAVLLGISTFAIIRIVREPKKHGRDSRFYGSHTGGRLADPVHDLQRHLDLRPGPRRGGEHRQLCPTATARSSRS